MVNAMPEPAERDDAHAWVERFDAVYRDADADHTRIPWSHRRPNPLLMRWLDDKGRDQLPERPRTAVVGCGLGTDAAALHNRGHAVTAFDPAPTAVEHAKKLHPELAHIFRVADAFDPPADMLGAFDLVAEVHTLQALPPRFRRPLARGIASLAAPGGIIVAVARARDENVDLTDIDGPPFPFTPSEFLDAFSQTGVDLTEPLHDAPDSNSPPVRRLRAVLRRG